MEKKSDKRLVIDDSHLDEEWDAIMKKVREILDEKKKVAEAAPKQGKPKTKVPGA